MKFLAARASSIFMIIAIGAFLQLPVLWLTEASAIRWVYCGVGLVVLPPLLYAVSNVRLTSVSRLFLVFLILYALAHLTFEFLVYNTGLRASMDTAAFIQSFWNFIQHGAFETTLDGQYSFVAPKVVNHFARHSSPILFLALIPYALYPEMSTLIVVKTLLLVVTGWLGWRWVLTQIPDAKDRSLAALLPFVLLLQVPLFLMRGFDETPFFPPLLLWSALAFQHGRKWQFVISCLLFSAVKETTLPVLLIWSVVAFLKKRELAFVVAPVAIGIISFGISFFWIIPHFNAGSGSPFFPYVSVALRNFDVARVASYCTQSLSNWGWLVIGSPLSLLALPELAVNSFFSGAFPIMIDLGERYQLVIASGCFLGVVETLPRLSRFLGDRFKVEDAQSLLIIFLVTLSFLGLQGGAGWAHNVWDRLLQDRIWDVECIEMVSATTDPVVADWRVCGYFAKRDALWAVSANFPLPEQVFSGVVWYVGAKERDFVHTAVSRWDTVCSGETIFVLKRPETQDAGDSNQDRESDSRE